MWRDRVPPGYRRDRFHDRYICNRCSSEVHNWYVHSQWHDELDCILGRAPEMTGIGADDVVHQANAEGHAVAEMGMWRGGWQEIRALAAADWAALRGAWGHARG